MSELKQNTTVRVAGSDINGSAATANYTSDAFKLEDKPWSINVWFTGLTVVGLQPRVIIEISDDPDGALASFNPLQNGTFTVPRGGDKSNFRYEWARVVYEFRGATAGLLNIDVSQVLQDGQ